MEEAQLFMQTAAIGDAGVRRIRAGKQGYPGDMQLTRDLDHLTVFPVADHGRRCVDTFEAIVAVRLRRRRLAGQCVGPCPWFANQIVAKRRRDIDAAFRETAVKVETAHRFAPREPDIELLELSFIAPSRPCA